MPKAPSSVIRAQSQPGAYLGESKEGKKPAGQMVSSTVGLMSEFVLAVLWSDLKLSAV